MAQLEPCPKCARHVRATSSTCPFCDAALTLRPAPRPTLPTGLSRAAIFALGTALTTAGCYLSHELGDDAGMAPPDLGHSFAPPYGIAPHDAGFVHPTPRSDAGPSELDAGAPIGPDGGGVVILYGGSP